MKRMTFGVTMVVLSVAMLTMAQVPGPVPPVPGPGPGGFNQQPGPGPGPDGYGGGGRGGRGRGGDFDGGRGGRGGDFDNRGGRGGGPRGGPDLRQFEVLRSYIEVVDHYTQMTRSADSAGVAAVVSATDILRQGGPQGAIDFLSNTLPEVKIPAIERAIRIQLADLYRQVGQSDKALEQLSVLMKAAP
jgi:hypothetical protein